MNELEAQLLIEARKKKGWTQTEMANKLAAALDQGYSMRQYQKLEEGKFPKYKRDIVTQLDKLLGTNLFQRLYAQNIPVSTNGTKKYATYKGVESKANEDQVTYKNVQDPKDLALLKLANSNEALARSHEKLVNMLERKFTESDDQRRLREAEATIRGTREFLCELDSHVNNRPVKESWELVGIKVDAALAEHDRKDNVAGAHIERK